jgi:hypothetical protein
MPKQARSKGGGRQARPGVWNRSLGKGPANPIRIRTKRLDEIDQDKIALAYWLLAKQIVEDQSDQPLSEAEVRRVAQEVEETTSTSTKRRNGGTARSRRHQ